MPESPLGALFKGMLAGHAEARERDMARQKLDLEGQLTKAKLKQMDIEEEMRKRTLQKEQDLASVLMGPAPLPADVQGPLAPSPLQALEAPEQQRLVRGVAETGAGGTALSTLMELIKEQNQRALLTQKQGTTKLHFTAPVQTESGQLVGAFDPATGELKRTTEFGPKPATGGGRAPTSVEELIITGSGGKYKTVEQAVNQGGPEGLALAQQSIEKAKETRPLTIAEARLRTGKEIEQETKLGPGVNLMQDLTTLSQKPNMFLPGSAGTSARVKQMKDYRERRSSGQDPDVGNFDQIREGLRGQLVRIGGDVGNFNISEQEKATNLIPDPEGGFSMTYPFFKLPDSKEVATRKLKMLGEFLQAGLEAPKGATKSQVQKRMRGILAELDTIEAAKNKGTLADPQAHAKLKMTRDGYLSGKVSKDELKSAFKGAGVPDGTIEDWFKKHPR